MRRIKESKKVTDPELRRSLRNIMSLGSELSIEIDEAMELIENLPTNSDVEVGVKALVDVVAGIKRTIGDLDRI